MKTPLETVERWAGGGPAAGWGGGEGLRRAVRRPGRGRIRSGMRRGLRAQDRIWPTRRLALECVGWRRVVAKVAMTLPAGMCNNPRSG